MRRSLFRMVFALAFLATVPALAQSRAAQADEAEFKKAIDQIIVDYTTSYNAKDAAALLPHYTADAIQINATGAHKVTPAFFENYWKASGMEKQSAVADQVVLLNSTTGIVEGTWSQSGKRPADGAAWTINGYWSAVYVKDGDKWKAKMLTAGLKPPAPMSAADAKTQLEALNTQYVALHNKQDAAGMAAMFTADSLNTVAGGTRKMDQAAFEARFKNGITNLESKLDQVVLLSPTVAIAYGDYHLTGKNPASGEAISNAGNFTGVYVREGNTWKIRAITGVPKPVK